MRRASFVIGALSALLLASGVRTNAAIPAIFLFNTGEVAAAEGINDINWNLDFAPTGPPEPPGAGGGTFTTSVAVNAPAKVTEIASTFPGGAWFANDASSKWISPQANYDPSPGGTPNDQTSDPVGFYTFSTTFNVGNFTDPSTFSLSGTWWNDNGGVDILLNGKSIFYGTPFLTNAPPTIPADYQQQGFASGQGAGFTINGNFLESGVNTLQFVSYNEAKPAGYLGGNPQGMRVVFTDYVPAIPEPAFYQMSALLLGGGVTVLRLRRNRKA